MKKPVLIVIYILLPLVILTIGMSLCFYTLPKKDDTNNSIITDQLENVPLTDSELTATLTRPDIPNDQSVLLDEKRSEKFRSAEADDIKKIIPVGVFLRDFIYLSKSNSYIVAYILNPKLQPLDKVLDYSSDGDWYPQSCADHDFGQTINGVYKLALIRDNKIINEIKVPFPDYDKWPDYRLDKPDENGAIGYGLINDVRGVWRDDGSLTFRQSKCSLEPDYYATDDWKCKYSGLDYVEIPLLNISDLTGDGLQYEFRLMTEYISCGNRYYVVAGYNAKSDKLVIYKIIDSDGSHVSYSNFNPKSDGSVEFDSGCDHGSENHSITYFKFIENRQAYVYQKSTPITACKWQ